MVISCLFKKFLDTVLFGNTVQQTRSAITISPHTERVGILSFRISLSVLKQLFSLSSTAGQKNSQHSYLACFGSFSEAFGHFYIYPVDE